MKRAAAVTACTIFLFGMGVFVFAQTANVNLVTGTELRVGNSLSERSVQSPGEGAPISAGDLAQTGAGTFADISFEGGAVIRLAENTSFLVQAIGSAAISVNLVYGRMLVKDKNSAVNINIYTGGSVTEVQDGEVNIDYMVVPKAQTSEKPVLSVTAIEGSPAVLPRYANPGFGRIAVKPGETLMVDALMSNLERFPMNKAILDYWNRIVAAPVFPVMTPILPEDNQIISDKTALSLKSATTAAGLTLMIGGIVLQAAMHTLESTYIQKENSDFVYAAGYIPIALGAFILFASAIFKP
ncbi:MAG: FecR family protein [Spirochaetaceae bacterium]|jgi:hypothetical protein|nr:FecR family protein [Spirochaetaceae bacterium]